MQRSDTPRDPAMTRIGTTRGVSALAASVLLVLTTLAGLLGFVGQVPSAAAFTLPPSGSIGPIAGSASGGDGGAATSASLNSPSAVAFDGSGNTYIAEANANRVRRVDTSGVITTIAGTGTAGYTGDTAAATSAALNSPQGLAIDGSSLYITDTGNAVVRRVDLGTGIITTFAGGGTSTTGGAPLSLRLASPWGIAASGGTVYVSDFAGRHIWKISGGSASNFAGTGGFTTIGTGGDGGAATSATFKTPAGIALDGSTLYVADPIDGRVRAISGGTINAFAGVAGSTSFGGDGGLATAANLFQPYGVTVRTTQVTSTDNNNAWSETFRTVVISDTQNQRVRYVPLAGTSSHGAVNPDIPSGGAALRIYTAMGNGSKTSTGDGGPASSATTKDPRGIGAIGGSVFVAEAQGNRVRRIAEASAVSGANEPANTSSTVALPASIVGTAAGNGSATLAGDNGPATSAGLANPQGVSFTPAGDLLIADTNNQAIRLVNANSGIITTVAGTGVRSNPPAVPLGDGGPATQATLNFPAAAAENAAGDIFIADTFNNLIRKVDHATGNISTLAGNGTRGFSGDGGAAVSAALNQPYGIAVDSAGNVVFSDTVNQRIRRVTTDGKINTVAGGGTGGLGDGAAALGANISYPSALSIDNMGNYLVADSGHSLVRRIVPGGIITTIAGGGNSLAENVPATTANLQFVSAVSADQYGEVFVADVSHNRIRRINTNGTITTVAGVPGASPGNGGYSGDGAAATSALMKAPFSLAVGPTGSVFVADTGNSRVRAIAGATSAAAIATGNYVTAAYHDFIGAAPTPAQFEAGILISDQINRFTFVNGLANTPQWEANIVQSFYVNTLNRVGSPSEVAYWVNNLQTGGWTVAREAAFFYASDEYYNHLGGGTDASWVTDLYHKLLNRNPDPGGVSYWVSQIPVMGRQGVAFSFYQTTESGHNRVANVYEEQCPTLAIPTCPAYRPLLNRPPDQGGLDYWTPRVLSSGDIVLAANLGSSDEYYANAQTRTF